MSDLSAWGFGPFFQEQLSNDPGGLPARVTAEHRGSYEVYSSAGAGAAELAGRLFRALGDADFPGVGDWVTLSAPPGPEGRAIIERVLERRTVFTRGAAGAATRTQVIAANVDRVFTVCGLNSDYNPRRIERYVARTWASGAQPVVVLSKADLSEEVEERRAEIEAVVIGVPVLVTSTEDEQGLHALRAQIRPGETTAFVGSSGAGKSTLINRLLGEARMAIGDVRLHDGRGRHTTSHRQLIPLPGGGLLIDTPGMRELQLVDDEGVGAVFTDLEALAEGCRFRDCSHDAEPGCAVRAAVELGELAPERLAAYRKLEAEARSFALRQDIHQRRQAERAFGKHINEVMRTKHQREKR